MDPQTSNFLVDLIPQGGFAGFLFWLYFTQKKDTQFLREESKREEERIRKEYREEENRIRNRFEKVIEGLNAEKENFRAALYDEVGKLSFRVSELEKSVAEIKTKIDNFMSTLSDRNQKK